MTSFPDENSIIINTIINIRQLWALFISHKDRIKKIKCDTKSPLNFMSHQSTRLHKYSILIDWLILFMRIKKILFLLLHLLVAFISLKYSSAMCNVILHLNLFFFTCWHDKGQAEHRKRKKNVVSNVNFFFIFGVYICLSLCQSEFAGGFVDFSWSRQQIFLFFVYFWIVDWVFLRYFQFDMDIGFNVI